MSRLKQSIVNIGTGVFGQVCVVIAQYISRMVLVTYLPIEYVGYSGLFTNILLVLSLAELGIGTAMTFCLYDPLARGDFGHIRALLEQLKKYYSIIAVVVLVVGLCAMPFLKYIIWGTPINHEVRIIYILYLMNTVVSYPFAYKTNLFIADQRFSTVNRIKYACMTFVNFTQAILIFLTKSYYLYMAAMIIGTFVQNIWISKRADKEYAYVFEAQVSQKALNKSKNILLKNMYAMSLHKLSSVAVLGTSNIFISAFAGIATVGLYSNYLMVKKWIDSLVNTFFNGILAAIGNINATNNKERMKEIFDTLYFISAGSFIFCAVCLCELFNPFISVWLGEEFLLPDSMRYVIVINFYLSSMRQPVIVFKNATGCFWNDRYASVAEAIINIIASIVLGYNFGLIGVLLATTISTLTTVFFIEPIVIYSNILDTNPVQYFKKYFEYAIYLIITEGMVHFLLSNLSWSGIGGFLGKLSVCILLTVVMVLVFLGRKKEFARVCQIVLRLIKKGE